MCVRPASGGYGVMRGNGAGGFHTFQALGTLNRPGAPTTADLSEDGFDDILVLGNTQNLLRVHLNDGHGSFLAPIAIAIAGPTDIAVADLDGDHHLDAVLATYDGVVVLRGDGSGALAPPVLLPTPGITGPTQPRVRVADLDSDLRADIVLASGLHNVLDFRGSGGGAFDAPRLFDGPYQSVDLALADVDHDGRIDALALGASPDVLSVLRNLPDILDTGTPFCLGDGLSTACPCGNASVPGDLAGCRKSTDTGGRLAGAGRASIAADSATLVGSGMPTGLAVFLRGTREVNSGSGTAFGDGLRCLDGTLARLGIRPNAGGGSSYPGLGDPRLSASSGAEPGAVTRYQIWYRDLAPFCSARMENLTNGVRLSWAP